MNPNLRLVLELVAYHGDLSVPNLRNLTLVSKDLTTVRELLLSKKRYGTDTLTHHRLIIDYTYYLSGISGEVEIKHGTCKSFYRNEKNERAGLFMWETYADSCKEGMEITWRESGAIWTKTPYKSDVREGIEVSAFTDETPSTGGRRSEATPLFIRRWKEDYSTENWVWLDAGVPDASRISHSVFVKCKKSEGTREVSRKYCRLDSKKGKKLTKWAMELLNEEN